MSETLSRTVGIKLDVGESVPALTLTQAAFNAAATWIAAVCWEERITNTNDAHRRVYGETRARFGLGAQLACCARAKAVEALGAARTKGETTCPTFGPRGSIRYDARTYRLLPLDRVSLNTLSGRVVCRLAPGRRQHAMLVDLDWKIGGADLVWRDGVYFLHVTQTRPAPATAGSGGVLGVDLGRLRASTLLHTREESMKIKRQIIVFDAADLAAESGFWAGLLGGTVKADDDWHNVVVDGEWRFGVQLAPNHVPPDWPDGTPEQQIHLDLYVDDLKTAHEQALSLGARLLKPADDPDAAQGFQVYADPAGHPFCLCWG